MNCNEVKLLTFSKQTLSFGLCQNDNWWGMQNIAKDPQIKRLSKQNAIHIVERCTETAESFAEKYEAYSGNPFSICESLGLKVIYDDKPLHPDYLLFGFYSPGNRTITIKKDAITHVENLMNFNQLHKLLPPFSFVDILLFHEIFHHLEDTTIEIYTRSKLVKSQFLGFIRKSSSLASASEIAAMVFSKKMAQISFHPSIFEWLLLWSYDKCPVVFYDTYMLK